MATKYMNVRANAFGRVENLHQRRDTMMNYAQAVQRTFEMTGTTSAEWRAVPVASMQEVAGPQGAVTLPVFVFPSGYTPVTTPFSDQPDCCHLCGHSIKNAYHIQHDARELTMVVGSDCVTHFGEGVTGAVAAKQDVRQQVRDLADDLCGLVRQMEQVGMYDQPIYRCGSPAGTRRVWSQHTEAGRLCRMAHNALLHVLIHNKGTVFNRFGNPPTDRVLANWHKNLLPHQVESARRMATKALAEIELQPA